MVTSAFRFRVTAIALAMALRLRRVAHLGFACAPAEPPFAPSDTTRMRPICDHDVAARA